MSQSVEAIIDEQGQVRLLRPMRFPSVRRAVVMILDDDPLDSARVSEPALAEDWNRPEEDAAWSHLQQGR
ncbi:MAG TPA: hypothetical protein PLQ52_01565 [Lacunisphaera sp.]|jgi:hypothetical protein|nr:hypothetical protein [Lacunisphaera sp.]HQY04729.1 hypothetical protein [Lacunisphaera sp.]